MLAKRIIPFSVSSPLCPAVLMLLMGMALTLLSPAAAAAPPTFYLQDGNGYWWDFSADGSVADGSPTPLESSDSFDGAMRLRVNGQLFADTASQAQDGRMIITGPQTVGGVLVTRRAYVPDTPGQGWACFLEYLENPAPAPVNVTVQVTGNLGSDGATTVTASSSGDAVFTPADRWVASDDANNGGGDPSLSFNYWGAGAPVTSTAVFLPASQENYYVEYPVTIPGESTVILMHFCAQNPNDAAAAATAAYLDGLPPATLVGLNAAYGSVINWNVPPDSLEITPSGAFVSEGRHGGPFTPVSRTQTLSNSGAAPLDWSATASEPWLTVPAGGTVDPGVPATADITINALANDLAPGEYQASVTFTNTTSGAMFVRNVRLMVTPRLSVAADDFYVSGSGVFVVRGRPGGPVAPLQAVYTLTNVDDQPMDWSVTTPPWLDASAVPAPGTPLAPGATAQITVSVNVAVAEGMTLGDYPATIDFNNDTIGNGTSVNALLLLRDAVYVNAAVASPGDGSSWAAAFDKIQDGIDAAVLATPPLWVFVAGGNYTETLNMPANVEVFGGFLGTESNAAERNLAANPPTVINANNAGRAVTFGAVDNAGLDGVTVTGGKAGSGGGVQFDGSGPGCYLDNVTVRENTAEYRGGGVYCLNGTAPSLRACNILGNRIVPVPPAAPDFGGGIACQESSPRLLDCVIAANDGRFGGGVGCVLSSPILTNCVISANSATIPAGGAGGGGIFAHNNSSPILTNCLITGNYAHDWNAGTLFCQGNSKPVLTNCTISGNSSNDGRSGGIVVNTGSNPTLVNCILDGLSGTAVIEEWPTGGLPQNESDVFVANSLFANNAVADFLDWGAGSQTTYTGGDAVNANVDGASGNVPGGPDPRYAGKITGLWSAAPAYSSGTNRTTLVTTGNPFPATPGALRGRVINPNTAQSRQAYIMDSTANSVTVIGDITAATGFLGFVHNGDGFMLPDYRLDGASPCVNVGDDAAPTVTATDLLGQPRVGPADLGAYECQTPGGVAVVSITPLGDPVTGASTLTFEVLFSRFVTGGLSAADFVVRFAGLDKTPPSVLSLSGSGYRWTVTVNSGNESGQLSLDLVDSGAPITDIIGLNLTEEFISGGTQTLAFLKISRHPVGSSKKQPGDAHTFSVIAQNGIGTLHYRWTHNGVPRGDDSPVLALTNLALGDTGSYVCEVTDDYITVASNPAVLVVSVVSRVPVAGGMGLALLAALCAGAGALRLRKKG
ncbi:MAG: right-handed parallel beta-helix repeat-containing protein [Candidatus Hydrogenedentes bacterium]|nr:right-handed parallel beta-helix repeat-containing protein [Candidatus Hydrogenedentota bacterium]